MQAVLVLDCLPGVHEIADIVEDWRIHVVHRGEEVVRVLEELGADGDAGGPHQFLGHVRLNLVRPGMADEVGRNRVGGVDGHCLSP